MIVPSHELHKVSPAFRQALLKSERKRIFAVVSFILFFAALIFVRIFLFSSAMSRWAFLATVLVAAYELWVLRWVNLALKGTITIPQTAWYLAIILETLLPAFGIAFLASPRLEFLYRPLATPWVLAFLPFIMLSVLRLNPALCRFAGIISTIGYLSAAYYKGWRPAPTLAEFSVTQSAVLMFALTLLICGFLAAEIAREIRLHVAAALHEAETMHKLKEVQHDLQIARTIQQSLLPKVRPKISGFSVGGWNQPADDIGGDFYDWKRLADGRLVVFLADVTGHGIGPAMLASVCRAYSRASFNTRDDLETTLKNINHSFAEDLTPERFATFVAVVCQDDENEVELLSAGHGPLFVYSSESQTFQYVDSQTLPLGILPEIEVAIPVKLDMRPGDIVLLITDGFFEWENAKGELFGTDRLAEVIRKFSSAEPEVIIAEIYQSVLAFAQGTKQKDDLTAVLIKRSAVAN
jgi:serine phosphatase RsbU (regulator of sigma subunit)